MNEILKGTGTILLVDDKDAILNMESKMLEKLGYRVLTANGGKEAVKIYKENKGKIDLAILDMIMPDMGGVDTFKAMREIGPNIKVLIASNCIIDYQVTETTEQ